MSTSTFSQSDLYILLTPKTQILSETKITESEARKDGTDRQETGSDGRGACSPGVVVYVNECVVVYQQPDISSDADLKHLLCINQRPRPASQAPSLFSCR